ncbi:hypothetical protein PV721_32395 [Streptomyces sp. MB09-01]|uniref:hypothetical protein n=1 Tax=Streptomyces sp. MB09-01 TaxID=3028666 RepID=UPI0029B0A210|nr:hypothetical protein [Streptomyces sp. MB09-01]MDX3538956.1 hypothetical protein [Streptomyces sp. MB09-01]
MDLIRVARQDTAHRRQALAELEEFVFGHRGRVGYRFEAVQDARTALCAFDPDRAVRGVVALEVTAAAVLATAAVTGFLLGGTGLTRVLVTVAVWMALWAGGVAFRQFWRPYLGAWVILSEPARWCRAFGVLVLAVFLTGIVRNAPTSPSTALLFAVAAGAAGWLLWLRKPHTPAS